MVEKRTYKPSAKREASSEQMRQRLKASAWAAFAQQGLDGTTISAIIADSGASTGSFYNYYGTKQAVFDELVSDLVITVRTITAQARARADDLETMLRLSYADLLDFILGIDGALAFIARNQHHIRSRLYALDSTSDLLDDIRLDVVRGLPGPPPEPAQVSLIASLIVANGIETLLLSGSDNADTASRADLMTRLIIHGITGLRDPQKT